MKANSLENLIADQLFKITKSDENISSYLRDCASPFTYRGEDQEVRSKVPHGIVGGLESQIKQKGRSRGAASI